MCQLSDKCNKRTLIFSMLLGLLGVLLGAQNTYAAAEAGSLQIQVGEKVIFCSASLAAIDVDQFRLPMQDGIAVATQWYLKIGKVRNYWLNETIGEISVIHRVEADLLSHSWLLIDVSSGISHRVYRINDAIDFLVKLDQFPILDRSLLLSGMQYKAVVKVEIHIGAVNDAWWAGLWPSAANAMQQDFKLP